MTPTAEASPTDPVARPLDTLLYSSPVLTIGKFRADPAHPRFHDSGPAGAHIFVFPRTLVRIRHEGAEPFVAGPDVVTFYNRGQVYRRDSVGGRSDRCEWFAFAPEVLVEAIGEKDPAVQEHPDRPFSVSHTRSEPVTYLLQRRVVESVARAGTDALEVEETMLDVLRRLIAGSDAARSKGVRAPVERRQRELAEAACVELARAPQDRRSLSGIASSLGTSVFHLCRVFRRHTGSTLHGYRTRLRMAMALERLARRDPDLTEIALSLGFSSHSHFTAAFRAEFGTTPSRFRKDLPIRSGHPAAWVRHRA